MTELLKLGDEDSYRSWWISNVAGKIELPILGIGTIPIFIESKIFDHACFESSHRDGRKDTFSLTRAQRINRIVPMIRSGGNGEYTFLRGYDKSRRCETSTRLAIVDEKDSFIVIISFFRPKKQNTFRLKGDFRTCYVADNSIKSIMRSRKWRYTDCCHEFGF